MVLFCVDDDSDDIELFLEAIKVIDCDCTCVSASSGYDALKMLESMKPDYIFLDINMPIMDGKETLRRIRRISRFEFIPICILSTHISRSDEAICYELGATVCLMKSPTFHGLVATLRGALKESL